MISTLRERLDKMTDTYMEQAFCLAHDLAIDAADDDGKIDLAELSAVLIKEENRFLDDMADVYSSEHRDIEESFDAIESELAELAEIREMPDHTEFLHELAADVTELSKYGNDTQKAQYLVYLDNCEELKEFSSSQSTLITSANLELVI